MLILKRSSRVLSRRRTRLVQSGIGMRQIAVVAVTVRAVGVWVVDRLVPFALWRRDICTLGSVGDRHKGV